MRVLARDGLFIGDPVHGALVTISDAASGELLAQGITRGKTGDPARVLSHAVPRGGGTAGADDAKFSATVDIERPRRVKVSAFGPLDHRPSANQATATQWIVPGKHITGGDGWTLELPGLLVSPKIAASSVSLETAVRGVRIEAEVMLLCGCPIRPESFWDPEDYEVVAIVHRGKQRFGRLPLRYAGSASDFETQFTTTLPGVYAISVYAFNAESGNTGVGSLELTVTEP